jgi:hypothetical protein
MCPSLYSSDMTNGTEIRKTSIIDNELTRLNIVIAALQKTRLKENGSVKERVTFSYLPDLMALCLTRPD